MQFEKPDSPEDLLARITVALLLTAVATGVIVGAVMWLLLDAPTWSLIAATAIIFALTLVLAFSPMDDDEDETEVEEAPRVELPRREFGLAGPRGQFGRWGQFGGFLAGIYGLNLVSWVLFELLWTAPLWVRPAWFVLSIVISFLMEYTTLGDETEYEPADSPATNADSSAVGYHSINRQRTTDTAADTAAES
jgi:putative flippase GtrA